MKNKLIKNYFEILGNKKENQRKFCVLDNKKTGRSVIFEKNNKKAIKFMKNKFASSKKKIAYILIKLKILCLFKKKLFLDSNIGQLIYFGGQTKIFNFDNNTVISFMRGPGWEKDFIKNKKQQKKLSKKGFAPKILNLNEKIPFCVEELLEEGNKLSEEIIFKKLVNYYKTQKKTKVSYSSYIKKLKNKKKFSLLPFYIKNELEKIEKKKEFFYVVKIHGDFEKNQILLKEKEILFTDWEIKKELILTDLFNFFKKKKKIIEDRNFRRILNMFPEEISKNLKEYFIVSQTEAFLNGFLSYKDLIKKTKKLFLSKSKKC